MFWRVWKVSKTLLYSNASNALGRRTLTRTGGDAHASGVLVGYDAAGRPAWQEDLAGNRTTYGYAPETGLRTSVTDALTNVVHTAYDLQGRVTNTWGATYPVGYEYDAYGRMSALQTWRDETAAPDVTRWNYDPATGLLTNKVYADGLGPQYAYDPAGRLVQRTWARGVETDYGYDALGQLTAIDYSDATPDVAYTYDRLGRQLTVTDVLGTRTNVYSPTDLLEERHPDGTTLVRSYDPLGRPSGLALGTNYAVGYGYDSFGRFSTVAVSNGATFTYSYVSDSSLLSGYTNDLGLAVAYEYESLRDHKTLVSNAWSTNPISTFAYTYDSVGRRIARIDDGLRTNVFGYNVRSELTEAQVFSNTYSYAYDPIGNRRFAAENGVTNFYAANELNQYTNAFAGEQTPEYDADGNMTFDGEHYFTWDAENRLVKVTPRIFITGTRYCEYAYDYMGRRIAKIEKRHTMPGDAWTTHTFDYDGWNLLRERTEQSASITTNHYVWGLDLSGTLQGAGGIGGLLASTLSGANLFYTCDANGNITDFLGEHGSLAAHYEYDGFGNTIAHSSASATANPFRFSSKYWDGEIGFYYYGYRFYCAGMGRWIGRDPIGEEGGCNLSAIVNNNAINLIDCLGQIILTYNPPPNRTVTPYDLGIEWLTGLGPRHRDFGDGDAFAEELRRHKHIQTKVKEVAATVTQMCNSDCTFTGPYVLSKKNASYKLGGVKGVINYLGDYSHLITFGAFGNLAVTFIGSYGATFTAKNIDCCNNTADLVIEIDNQSHAASALRPPVLGYFDWWQNHIEPGIDRLFPKGPASPTTQNVTLTEKLTLSSDCTSRKP